jgi:hypothetical protein
MKKLLCSLLLYCAITQPSEFTKQYQKLVGMGKETNKETKKLVESTKPIKLLSYDLLNKWKLISNLLMSDVRADATFESIRYKKTGKNFLEYVTELKELVSNLYKQGSVIIEQYPMATYKKSLFKSKPKYTEEQITAARRKIKKTREDDSQTRTIGLATISSDATRIKVQLSGISTEGLTTEQQELCKMAIDFTNKVADLALNLENEINALP